MGVSHVLELLKRMPHDEMALNRTFDSAPPAHLTNLNTMKLKYDQVLGAMAIALAVIAFVLALIFLK